MTWLVPDIDVAMGPDRSADLLLRKPDIGNPFRQVLAASHRAIQRAEIGSGSMRLEDLRRVEEDAYRIYRESAETSIPSHERFQSPYRYPKIESLRSSYVDGKGPAAMRCSRAPCLR